MRVSPSAVEALETCALRAVLERRGARRPAADAQSMGILVHAAAEGLGRGVPRAEVDAALEAHLAAQDQLPEWQRNRLRRFVTAMTEAVAGWIADNADQRRPLGVEVPLDVRLPADDGEANPVRLSGRVDWLGVRVDDGTAGRLRLQDQLDAADQGRRRGERPAGHLPAGRRARRLRRATAGPATGWADWCTCAPAAPRCSSQPPLPEAGRADREARAPGSRPAGGGRSAGHGEQALRPVRGADELPVAARGPAGDPMTGDRRRRWTAPRWPRRSVCRRRPRSRPR